MTGLEIPIATPVEQNTPPEYVNNVAMDIELGSMVRPGEVIEFDYDAYYSLAKDMGASDEDIAQLNIEVVSPMSVPRNYNGSYSAALGQDHTPQHKVKVVMGRFRAEKKMNRIMAHETRHYIDNQQGNLEPLSEKYLKAVEVSKHQGRHLLATCLGGAALVTGAITGNIVVSGLGVPLIAYQFVKAKQVLGAYGREPSEVRARKAEKEFGDRRSLTVTGQ